MFTTADTYVVHIDPALAGDLRLLVIAAAAERTSRIRFGTGVIQLGLHHPLVALDRMILLDHLTRGRVSFGMGVGGGIPSDLSVFGLTPELAGRRMQESIDVMMELLTSSTPVTELTVRPSVIHRRATTPWIVPARPSSRSSIVEVSFGGEETKQIDRWPSSMR